MAVTTEYSTEYASAINSKTPVDVNKWGGKVKIQFFEFTQGAAAGDAGSYAYLCKLPPGTVRVLLKQSFLGTSAMGTSRTLDLGWAAYTGQDGVAVNADPNGLDDGVDVSSAATTTPGGTVGGSETYLFSSQGGVAITAQINDGTIPAAATIKGYIAYVRD